MQFQIPQFIEDETLLLGPLTVTQSGYIGGAVALAFFVHMFPFLGTVAWMLSGVLIVAGIALAFVKIEGRSLPTVITNFFSFFSSSKLYLWEMKPFTPKVLKKEKKEIKTIEQKYALLKGSKSNLSNLLFELNIGEKKEENEK